METKQLIKKCSKCGEVKPLSEFSKDKYRKDGKCTYCKECIIKYYQENKGKISKLHKIYHQKNKEKIRKQQKIYRQENWEKELNQRKIWYQNNKEKIAKRRREIYKKNRNRYLEYSREYRESNREKCRESSRKSCSRDINKEARNKRENNRLRVDLKYNLNHRMSYMIWHSLKGNKAGRHWEDLVDYTLKDLMRRLKKTMPEGYNWQDYLDGKLHIDHIIPKSIFNYTKSEHIDFRRCWALKNLQLLSAKENLIKNNHFYKPFQPSLAI